MCPRLERLAACWQRLTQCAAGRVRGELVDRLLADVCQSANLRKAPIVQAIGTIAKLHVEPSFDGYRPDLQRRVPPVLRLFLVSKTVLMQRIERFEPLIGATGKQLTTCLSQIHRNLLSGRWGRGTLRACTTGLSANGAREGSVDRKTVNGVYPSGDEKQRFTRSYVAVE